MSNAATPADWANGLHLTAGPYFLGLYQPSPETKDFWAGVELRELLLKFCAESGNWLHPKRIVCPDCGSDKLEMRRASGRGKVYSFSEVHRAASPAFAKSAPYVIGVVRLEEGVHLFTRIIPGSAPVKIDAPVQVDFRVLELGQLLPVFVVAA